MAAWHHLAGGRVLTPLFYVFCFLKSSCGDEKMAVGKRGARKASLVETAQGRGPSEAFWE